jgi:hypothetical protein
MNARSIGIEHVAKLGDKITDAQSETSIALIRWLMHTYSVAPSNVIPHVCVKPTDCCGDLFKDFGGGAGLSCTQQKAAVGRWLRANGIGDVSEPEAAESGLGTTTGLRELAAANNIAAFETQPGRLSDRVPIPPRDTINVGLTACSERTMLGQFGRPGALTNDCSEPTGQFRHRVRQRFDVGPFKVSGLDYAVESLLQIFTEVRRDNSLLFEQVKNEGMLCVRARRHNPAHYSNHSWGTAIDIFFGSGVVDQGERVTHRGNLLLAPYFNRHGWYWGAGFSGDSVDSMHFELAEETIHRIPERAMFEEATLSEQETLEREAALDVGAYRPDPSAAHTLGDIVDLLSRATPTGDHFPGVKFVATLPDDELYFDSELQLDTDGWPDGRGRGDSSWQPETSLRYADSTSINANRVPYFVLPKNWASHFNIKLGDLAAILYKDKLAFAVFADHGPARKLGEGSLELLRRLGEERLRHNGRVINSGMGPGVITIVFPGSRSATHLSDEETLLDSIEEQGRSLFGRLGGTLPST